MRTAVLVCGVLALLAVAGVRAAVSVDEGVVGESAAQAGTDVAQADAQADAQAAEQQQQQQETVTVEKVLGTGGSEVVELGSSAVSDEGVHEWADVVGRDLPVLVEFYLPTCGHCQGFAPEYERVAKAFHSQPVIIARIDANRWTSISDQYRVKGVPDLRFFPAGSTDDQPYMRARVATDIVAFVNDYAGTKVAFDYSFRQQHDTAVVDAGTCPVGHAALLEADAVTALDAAEAEAADAEQAVEDADEAADEAEEEADADADADAEEALADAIAESEADADAHATEAEIAEDAELEGEVEAEAEADEADADEADADV